MNELKTIDHKSMKTKKVCVIPYVDHVVTRCLKELADVNVLDPCDRLDANAVPAGVNLFVGDPLDKAVKGESQSDTPLMRAIDGCDEIYFLSTVNSEMFRDIDAGRYAALMKVVTKLRKEGKDVPKPVLVLSHDEEVLEEEIEKAIQNAIDDKEVDTKEEIQEFAQNWMENFIGDRDAQLARALPSSTLGT